MINRRLLIIIAFLLPIAIFSVFIKDSNSFVLNKKEKNGYLKPLENITANILNMNLSEKTDNDIKVNLTLSETNETITIDLEDYVIGVVAAEMPVSFQEEALKCGAIAARTYVMKKIVKGNYTLDDTIANQVYVSKEKMKNNWKEKFEENYSKISKAVKDTKGLVMKYNNNIIVAYYYSMSNGKTENVEEVFGYNYPYLKSVDSSLDKNVKNFEMSVAYTKDEFCNGLGIDCTQGIEINSINKNSSGRVSTIIINGTEFTGVQVRKLLKLRSTDFNIEIKDQVYISTRGYGHGVGMSQYGANEMAKIGKTYDEILKHYYQNIEISKI